MLWSQWYSVTVGVKHQSFLLVIIIQKITSQFGNLILSTFQSDRCLLQIDIFVHICTSKITSSFIKFIKIPLLGKPFYIFKTVLTKYTMFNVSCRWFNLCTICVLCPDRNSGQKDMYNFPNSLFCSLLIFFYRCMSFLICTLYLKHLLCLCCSI